jgi:glutamyl-tRNA synthetase
VRRQLERLGADPGTRDLLPLIDAVKARSRTIIQLADQVAVRLAGPRGAPDAKAEALMKKMGGAFQESLQRAADVLGSLPDSGWHADAILDALKASAESSGTKLGDAMQPVRVALTGSTVSEPVNELLAVVGRDASLDRLRRATGA